jgi:hypothetical protein
MWTFRCSCQSAEKVYVQDVVDILLPMKLRRYQLTKEEYYSLRRSGISDNEMEKRYLSGVKIK